MPTEPSFVAGTFPCLLRSILPSWFLIWLTGAPGSAKPTVDFDPQVDFSKFKTFTFIGGVENLVMLQIESRSD